MKGLNLHSAIITMHNNMKQKGTWDETDPKDAKIMALVTKTLIVEKQLDQALHPSN